MIFSKQIVEQVGKLAGIFLPISDIAAIIGVDADELRREINRKSSEVGKEYRRVKAVTKAQLQAKEMQLAKIGSPLGIESTKQALINMELDE